MPRAPAVKAMLSVVKTCFLRFLFFFTRALKRASVVNAKSPVVKTPGPSVVKTISSVVKKSLYKGFPKDAHRVCSKDAGHP